MKYCPVCKKQLVKVGSVGLNFRHGIAGGNIIKAVFWNGGYQLYVLVTVFILTMLASSKNLELALFFVFLPGLVIFLKMMASPYSLYSCQVCKTQYAGPLLAKYQHGDSTYL